MLSAIVLAAGKGVRLNSALPKPLVKIGGKPAIARSLAVLDRHPAVDEIVVVFGPDSRARIIDAVNKGRFRKVKVFVQGGRRRQDSVFNGLKALSERSGWVLVHDSARPFPEEKMITKVIRKAKKSGAAILAVRPKATIKFSAGGKAVTRTMERGKLWEAQTPQVFRKDLLVRAYLKYGRDDVTDDASLVEKIGGRVDIVEGSYRNIKITTVDDLSIADFIAREESHAL
ncbi:MAG: 2-C-methyl-D-erythritol 4-phosphate cytidylyltransferase [Candidatus Omnitrophica bacterium]|nr:2-C-methyl-D-erythritol 4-phosphate cytidylyltransferase [Candidatus Omnitrophota bacterium]MDD5042756.1 2-C-methyl-D-erythritol 4-phosphate cytidylyltransferase [Candidatus Omnitrophota bacterium]MDD5501510.1 2-C-methyl-D-erythritol 4-phosphate cytidylyltransferase [Candidatus Omnitrophota bacterium]